MVRIRRKLDSDTLHLPELKPLIGRIVEITIEIEPPDVHDEFWAEISSLPETPEAFEAQIALFRAWRSDLRFKAYWSVLDQLVNRTIDRVRKWAALQAQLPLVDYDYNAILDQDACDIEDSRRR